MLLSQRRTQAGFLLFVILYFQAGAAEPGQASSPPTIVPPLAHAELSPALKEAAEHDQITLFSRDVQSVAPATGDAVVFWIGTARDQKTQQWLVQLKRGIATPEEQKKHHGHDVKKYLSWGSVVVFHSEVDALDLWIAGPVDIDDNSQKNVGHPPLPAVRRTRVFVPRDYLRLGLDDSVRANQYMNKRIRALLKEDPKFGAGHIYALDKPIKPENIAMAKPVAERIGFTPAMEQAWMGGYVALNAFYELADEVPELHEIANVALDRPAPWKYAKLAFGEHFRTFFGGGDAHLIDPLKMGLLPVALESFEAPFSFSLGKDPIVSGAIAVTSPITPLDVSAGILGFVAIHPKDKTRMIHLVAISATRGNAKSTQKP